MNKLLFSLLKQHGIKPTKRLGQNFLIDKKVLHKIINAAELSKDDIVLEVGPGLGVLTLELAKRVKKVIAVEKDRKMVEALKKILQKNNIQNVEIIKGDILKLIPNDQFQNYKIVANIPYYLTSPLIRKFLETDNPPQLMLLMLQKEVAQRICACPPALCRRHGRRAKPPHMTLLSTAVQFYAEPKIISYVSKKSFWPQPKVDSAIIRIVPRTISTPSFFSPLLRGRLSGGQFHNCFFKIVRAGFSHPRKQIINNLSTALKIERQEMQKMLLKAGIKPTQRPQELAVDNWCKLAVLFVEKILYNKK